MHLTLKLSSSELKPWQAKELTYTEDSLNLPIFLCTVTDWGLSYSHLLSQLIEGNFANSPHLCHHTITFEAEQRIQGNLKML